MKRMVPSFKTVARGLPRKRSAAWCVAALLSLACSPDESVGPAADPAEPVVDAPVSATDSDSVVIVTDSTGDGIDPALAAAETGTTIYPGQNIQAKVDKYGAGTRFLLKAGIHRLQMITPKSGMSFVGEPGAILNGSRLLTTFTRTGGYWVASGQTQQGPLYKQAVTHCLPDSPGCAYPEQLFINGKLLKHMKSLAAVGSGKWYFDYAADKIYFVDDPTGKKVETSVSRYAFKRPASGVTISGLIIEKYATPPSEGTIDAGSDWVVKNTEVRWNQGKGVRTGPRLQLLDNNIHHQGQLGIAGSGDNMLVQGNELAYNNTAGFTTGWEAGATKFTRTNGLVVRGNFSHHNGGPGLWTDIDNINTLYENNRVEDNDWRGIFHEISYKAVIRNNICRRNGFKNPLPNVAPVDGAGILVSSSPNVEIYGNTIEGNRTGIGALQTNRGSGAYGVHETSSLNVHDNTVVQPTGLAAGIVQNVGSNAVYTSKNNRFTHNSYDLGPNTRYFRWMNADRMTQEWKGYGNDVTGTFR
jgi:parallel beta-helix repeat protein